MKAKLHKGGNEETVNGGEHLPHIQLLLKTFVRLFYVVLEHFQLVSPTVDEVVARNHDLGHIAEGIRVYIKCRHHCSFLGYISAVSTRRRADAGDSQLIRGWLRLANR